ncbi:MAG: DUF362 domain-containing protein, partial [Kiritimatiellae bacterium]|nr:DUF362 domain-containing protein [Kiritimatiellia bacterium]MDW8459480.1 DUF362 domain-containing protein [Verrucomicrobiota bacterium]
WRMTADLARIIHFADRDGVIRDVPQRRLFSLIDGVIAGEGEGPLAPRARLAGVMVMSENLLAADLAATRLMGFDPRKIKQFSIMGGTADYGVRKLEDLELYVSGRQIPAKIFFSREWNCPIPPFEPHPGWIGHIELARQSSGATIS